MTSFEALLEQRPVLLDGGFATRLEARGHDLLGQGVGRQLMRKLVKWARGKYLDRMYGDIAQGNEPMLQLAASLGFKQVPHPSGRPGLVRMVLELGS